MKFLGHIATMIGLFLFAANPMALARSHSATLIADSSSRNAVSLSSARTVKRFLSSRCASAIQMLHPLESIAET